MVKVIAEIGINHDGDFNKALEMVYAARECGVDIVKFQCHVIEDEMIPVAAEVIPPNATESIYAIMQRCALTENQDYELKQLTEALGMEYLSTPFSRMAADRLNRLGVKSIKVGSGECNNYPLLRHIAEMQKSVILSTGMNGIYAISQAVRILAPNIRAILHCVSMYPTPYHLVGLQAITELRGIFRPYPVGLSDHSLGIYTSLAAIPLGAEYIEKHFTIDKKWPGPDNPISLNPQEMTELVKGCHAVDAAMHGNKRVLVEEQGVINFAYASVVSTETIIQGERFTPENTWVMRPGGGIPASEYYDVLGKTAAEDIPAMVQIRKDWICE